MKAAKAGTRPEEPLTRTASLLRYLNVSRCIRPVFLIDWTDFPCEDPVPAVAQRASRTPDATSEFNTPALCASLLSVLAARTILSLPYPQKLM